jgi:hypothetical protein
MYTQGIKQTKVHVCLTPHLRMTLNKVETEVEKIVTISQSLKSRELNFRNACFQNSSREEKKKLEVNCSF